MLWLSVHMSVNYHQNGSVSLPCSSLWLPSKRDTDLQTISNSSQSGHEVWRNHHHRRA